MFTQVRPRSTYLLFNDNTDHRTLSTNNADMVAPVISLVLQQEFERQRAFLDEGKPRPARRAVADHAVDESPPVTTTQYAGSQSRPATVFSAAIR